MTMLLSQIRTPQGVAVVARDGSEAAVVRGATSVRDLALEALASGRGLAQTVAAHGLGEAVTWRRRPRQATSSRPSTIRTPRIST
jgi:hypothetical protein